MALKQSRRTFSVSRATYDVATEAARAEGIATSEWITRLVRAACPDLAPQIHATPRPERDERVVVHVPNATAEPPKPRVVVPGPITQGFCAVCTSDRGPFTRHPLGKDNALVLVCERCRDADWKRGAA